MCDEGKGVGSTGLAVYLDFAEAIKRLGQKEIEARYGNLFQMYEKIVAEDPYKTPMMIYPASHYAMGGLWVDYNLMSTIPGLFVLGEANFSDHGANRLGASALMQGLADGYFVIPNTINGYLAGTRFGEVTVSHEAFKESEAAVEAQVRRLLNIKGKRTVQDFHRDLGNIMWEYCGMGRTDEGLTKGRKLLAEVKAEFWENVTVPGSHADLSRAWKTPGGWRISWSSPTSCSWTPWPAGNPAAAISMRPSRPRITRRYVMMST
jgi:succinate dehydrogenase / fumarate reductase flavoprotein subunit